MCSSVVGLFGEPFDINTSSEFSSAVLTFKVDKSMLGDTEFDNLLFLWYDEENENFVELDTEHDEENSTVSTTVTHFSKYMIVDGLAWYTNWQMISKEMVDNGLVDEQSLLSKPSVAIGIPTVYSDSSSDPVTVNEDGSISCKRIDAFRYIYESLSPGQNYSLNFSIYGSDGYIHAKRLYCDELENDGLVDKYLNDLGFEDWEERSDFFLTHLAFYTYIDYNNTHFDVAIILISDDYHLDDMYTVLLNSAHDNRFVFIDMRDVTDHYLINRAEATGGLYMKYSDHAMNYLRKILRGEARFEDYDNDGDGFSDLEEKRGLIYDQAGNKVKTYWQFPDSDFDDLDDNEEVDVELTTVSIPGKCGNPDTIKYYHKMYSKPMLKDSDGDGLSDYAETKTYGSNPLSFNATYDDKFGSFMYNGEYYGIYVPAYSDTNNTEKWELVAVENAFDDNFDYCQFFTGIELEDWERKAIYGGYYRLDRRMQPGRKHNYPNYTKSDLRANTITGCAVLLSGVVSSIDANYSYIKIQFRFEKCGFKKRVIITAGSSEINNMYTTYANDIPYSLYIQHHDSPYQSALEQEKIIELYNKLTNKKLETGPSEKKSVKSQQTVIK